MAHYALVIGIDRYESAALNLRGAVADALGMIEWLRDPAGGGVPQENLFALLSPLAGGAVPMSAPPATRASITRLLHELSCKAADPGDRLYFYFSGHGLAAPSDIVEEALLPSDFTEDQPNVSIGIRSILQWLQTSRFNQQFFFIDGCRNVPFAQRFVLGQFPWVPDPAKLRPEVEQFVYMATARGLQAVEARALGGTRAGVFTEALLDGLRGAGFAKVYQVAERKYQVTTSRLLSYLVARVRAQIAQLNLPRAGDFLQTPTLSGERFSDPVLAELAPEAVDKVKLQVDIQPKEASPLVHLDIQRDQTVASVGPPARPCEVIELPPKEYRLLVEAAGFVPDKPLWKLDLYTSQAVSIALTAARARLTVAALDGIGPIEIMSDRGELKARGRSALDTELEPGVYRARLLSPEGAVVEQMISLRPGECESVTLAPPTPPAARPVRAASGNGIPREAESAARIRFEDECAPGAYLGTVRLALWKFADAAPAAWETPAALGDTVAEYAAPLSPGAGWLSVRAADHAPVTFPLVSLAGRVTNLVFHRDRRKQVSVLQFHSAVNSSGPAAPPPPLELALRFYQNGQFRQAAGVVPPPDDDPIAGLLGAYLALRLIQSGRGDGAMPERKRYPLSDSFVIDAEAAWLEGDICAAASLLVQALDCGVPVFAEGVTRLRAGIARSGLHDPRTPRLDEILRHRVTGLIWTAFRPPE